MKLPVYLFLLSFCSLAHAEEKKPVLPSVSFGPFPLQSVRTHIWSVAGTPASKAELNSPFPNDFPPSVTIGLEDARPYPATKKGARYFFPGRNYIRVYRIVDVEHAPYKTIQGQISSLRKLLQERPASIQDDDKHYFPLPDYPPRNAAHAIQLKLSYLDAPWGSGLCYVTQFTQDGGTPANNEELTYLFQGLTKDGANYISADFRITHPKLPKGIDDAPRDREKGDYHLDRLLLSKQTDSSFSPSLVKLRQWLQSIEIE